MKENENEKRDTIENVLAEYRNDADAMDRGWLYQPTTEYLRRLLDRIEATWKREREELDKRISDLEAYAKLWTGRADELRLKCDEFYAKAKPVGNAAAMREALETIHDKVNSLDEECGVDPVEIRDLARAALAAPARNCDRFADETDAQIAFLNEVWLISINRETMLEQDTYENWTDEMRTKYGRWLLAPAAERKGEGDA